MSRRMSVRRHINQTLRADGAPPSSSAAAAGGSSALPVPRGGAMKPVHPASSFRVRSRPSPRKLVPVDSFAGGSAVAVQPLGVDTLRPLVDLAYWSTFVEVRRDCAAAFATLSMNDANLDVLSQAGALGALLALVGVGNHKNDSQVHRDAATALSQLVKLDDIKLRLLKAPDGLKALFYMTRSPSVSVKRAATKTLHNLAAIDEAKEAIFAGAGIRLLLNLVTVKDEKTKRAAVKVIRRCTELEANRALFMDPATLRSVVGLLMDTPDAVMRRDLIEVVNLLAQIDSHKEILMDMGLLPALLRHADLTLSTVQMSLQCVECLALLVSDSPKNQTFIVDRGAIGTLVRCVFEDLPRFFSRQASKSRQAAQGGSSSLVSAGLSLRVGNEPGAGTGGKNSNGTNKTKKKKGHKKGPAGGHHHHRHHHHAKKSGGGHHHHHHHHHHHGQHEVSPQLSLTRTCMAIFRDVSSQRKCRDTLIEWGLLDYLLQDSVSFAVDRRTRRMASKIIMLLSENGGEGTVRHQDMVAKGCLPVLIQFLQGEDYELRMDAAAALAHMCMSDELKGPICQANVLPVLLPLIELQDATVATHVTRVLAEVADVSSNESAIVASGGLGVLVRMISPQMAHFKAARLEAVRALSSLSSSERVRSKMIGNNALGYLISISKTGKGLEKMYALATLTNLAHDTAALRIQMAFRGFVARKSTEKRRSKWGKASAKRSFKKK